MGYFKSYMASLHKLTKPYCRPLDNVLKKLEKFNTNGKQHKRHFSGFNWLNTSFATMEVSNQLKHVFKFIDTNEDGKISPSELSELLLCLGHERATAVKEAERMVKELDYNGDGCIDLDEFMNVLSNFDNSKRLSSKISDKYEQDDNLMDAFRIFDSDKNGLISAKELHKVLDNLGFEKCSIQECRKMIKGVDKDGDGFVNFEEFRSMMIAHVN